jgi:hypothetical protein
MVDFAMLVFDRQSHPPNVIQSRDRMYFSDQRGLNSGAIRFVQANPLFESLDLGFSRICNFDVARSLVVSQKLSGHSVGK